MSKHMEHKDAMCDRYKHEDSQVIYCDGIKEGTVVHLAFANRGIALDYKKKYCRADYKSCPLRNLAREE